MTFETINSTVHRHPILSVLLSPIIGGIFVLTFPLVVLVMIVAAAARVTYKGVIAWTVANSHLAKMNWQPGAAYLVKKEKKDQEKVE